MMNALRTNSLHVSESGLDPIVEPLASYICAADRPGDALETILAELFRQVEQTNRSARARVNLFLKTQTSVPA